MQNLTNISNYLGEYKTGVDYKKFDFVYNKADGLYYYAKDDISWQDEYIVSDVNRFTLDPKGPLYNGLQTYYLFDSQNNMTNYKVGQQIKIEGSTFTNNGQYKIIDIEENYNPNAIKAGDYILSEILNGTEGMSDWFESDWFLFGEKNFYWPGRDFSAYVDSYIDLLQVYESSGTTLSKEQWGRQHYKDYGESENRSIPLNSVGNWMYNPFLGWVYASSSSLNPSDKSIWFYIGGQSKQDDPKNSIWFFSKKDWTSGDKAVLYYEEEADDEYGFVKTDENKTFQSDNTKEINVSSDGSAMIARTDSSITRYTKAGNVWSGGASLDFNGAAFRYLACDENCNTIAVLTYKDRYYTLNSSMVIDYKTDYEYNSKKVDSSYSIIISGVPWATVNQSATRESLIDFEEIYNLKYAADVKIYKYNSNSNSWNESHTIEKVVEKDIVANFSADGNSLCIFEPSFFEYYAFDKRILTGDTQRISIFEYTQSTWGRGLTLNSSNFNSWSTKPQDADEYGYSLGLTKKMKVGFSGQRENEDYLLGMNKDFVNYDQHSRSSEMYISEGRFVYMSPNGKRLFYVDKNRDIICIKKSDEHGWTNYKNDDSHPEDKVWPLDIQKIKIENKFKEDSGWGANYKDYNIKTNYDGTLVVTFGDTKINNNRKIFNEYDQTYSSLGDITEHSFVEEQGVWKYKEMVFTFNYIYNIFINDLIVSKNESGNVKIAAVAGRGVAAKNNYKLQYSGNFDDPGDASEFLDYKKASVCILELNDQQEWVSVNGDKMIENSIDFDADQNLEKIFNLEYDPLITYKNKLYNYTFGYNKFYSLGEPSGFIYAQPSEPTNSLIKGGLLDLYSIDQQQWYVYKDGRIYQDDINRAAPTININYQQSQVQELTETKNYGTRVWLKGSSGNYSIDVYEPRSTNEITITSENINPSVESSDWIADQFFFDADYGSSVTFRCENRKNEYSDGYYTYQPVGINSVKIEIDLQFKNRTNRETNAIIHFVESHFGQYDKDRASPNLKYNQGIGGFRWAGESTFHPYDSTDMQSKTFYCLSFNHSLNFENSNDVSIKLNNFDTSLLNKSESLYVAGVDSYSGLENYIRNDIVLFEGNHKYYYCISDSFVQEVTPAVKTETWQRNGGYFLDTNQGVWTRDFLWRPSIGLKVSQAPRLKNISLTKDYTQIHRDGINESLLVLDLEFNNRTDDEARAILHYLEHHYGCVPFRFNAPAPYEKDRNFVCQQWTHTYNYKNNHSIKAKFEEFPFNLDASKYDAIVTEPILRESEFLIANSISFADDSEDLNYQNKFRKRITFRNTGDKSLTVNSVKIEDGPFVIVARNSSDDVPVLIEGEEYDYIFQLSPDSSLPFGLNNQNIKMFKQYSDGVSGGMTFAAIDSNGNRLINNGKASSFLQNNTGTILNLVTGETNAGYDKFINELFIQNNAASGTIQPGETGYIDVYYDGSLSAGDFTSQMSGLDGLVTVTPRTKTFSGSLRFGVTHSDGSNETIKAALTIELHR